MIKVYITHSVVRQLSTSTDYGPFTDISRQQREVLLCPSWLLCSSTFNRLFLVLLLCILLINRLDGCIYVAFLMFGNIVFAGNGVLLKKETKEDTASMAFCCVGNGEEATLRKAGKEKEELAKKKKE